MGEVYIGGKQKTYNVFVDEREKVKRLEFIVFLELNGYILDKDETRSKETIAEKTGADIVFIEDVTRMYVTHPGVSVQGILDRIEIKGK